MSITQKQAAREFVEQWTYRRGSEKVATGGSGSGKKGMVAKEGT